MDINFNTKYLFFTGKGGVGKTSCASAIAVAMADGGKRVLLVSTDPASNLQDVFNRPLNDKGVEITEVPGLFVANLDPIEAAEAYKESVIAPYVGKLPQSVIDNMAEQLSGSCTVEIAAFNAFSERITSSDISHQYDHIIFDTAPTGHTLRLLQLPSAWHTFINENTQGASCLGQLSGLEDKKNMYEQAVKSLTDENLTTLVIVTRPEKSPLKEASRAKKELGKIGIERQVLLVNGILENWDDDISRRFFDRQQQALMDMPENLKVLKRYDLPLKSFNISNIEAIRKFWRKEILDFQFQDTSEDINRPLDLLVSDLINTNKKIVFTMGKGGVGKTTLAAEIAKAISSNGKKVHLTTTDPAAHLSHVISDYEGITLSYIDEKQALESYRTEVLSQASNTLSPNDLAYIEEDLRSPCTQEIAVFRAFAEVISKSNNEVVVVDTAPTGHTLLLLDAAQSYHKEIERSQGQVPESVRQLLPRLRSREDTEVVIVTLPEATPFYEAQRLKVDLERAKIPNNWWILNGALSATKTKNVLLNAKSNAESKWTQAVNELTNGQFVIVPWS